MADNRLKVTGGKCRSILDNWDNNVIISLSGQPLGNSLCLPLDEIILEGRCRDFTALRSKSVSNSVLETEFNRADNHYEANFQMHRFVCLKRSILPVAIASLTELVTVKISSLSDLNSIGGSNLFARTESFGVQKLVKWMSANAISVIFCSDSIDDDVVHLFASHGISMVRSHFWI